MPDEPEYEDVPEELSGEEAVREHLAQQHTHNQPQGQGPSQPTVSNNFVCSACGAGPFESARALAMHEGRIHVTTKMAERRMRIREGGDAEPRYEESPPRVPGQGQWANEGNEGPPQFQPPSDPMGELPSRPLDFSPESTFSRKVIELISIFGYNSGDWKYRKNIIYRQLAQFGASFQNNPISLAQYLGTVGVKSEHIQLIVMEVCGANQYTPPGFGFQGFPQGQPQAQFNPLQPSMPAVAPTQGGGSIGYNEVERMKQYADLFRSFGWIPPNGGNGNNNSPNQPTIKDMLDAIRTGKDMAGQGNNGTGGYGDVLKAISEQNKTLLSTIIENRSNQGQSLSSIVTELRSLGIVGNANQQPIYQPPTFEQELEKLKRLKDYNMIGVPESIEAIKVKGEIDIAKDRMKLEQQKMQEDRDRAVREKEEQKLAMERMMGIAGKVIEGVAKPLSAAVGEGLKQSIATGGANQLQQMDPAQRAKLLAEYKAKIEAAQAQANAEVQQGGS